MTGKKVDLNSINFLTLYEVSEQDVFDKIATHMLTQNCRAVNGVQCCYRANDDYGNVLRCAAGCLIPDELYDPKLEGRGWGYVSTILAEKIKRAGLGYFHKDLIKKMQLIHDTHSVVVWKEKLAKLAVKFNLNSDILNNF